MVFQTVHDVMLMLDHEQTGREASPVTSVVDSQTIKVPHAPRDGGYDAAKRTKGRKLHMALYTDGRLLVVDMATTDMQDATGAEAIIKRVHRRWPWLKHLFADGAYDQGRLASLAAYKNFTLEVMRKLPDQKGFQVLLRRWAMERTLG